MKRILAVVLCLALLVSSFAVSESRVDAKLKKGYYFAALQKKKSFFGYVKKVKIVEGYVTVKKTVKKGDEEIVKKVKKKKGLDKIITYGAYNFRKKDKGASSYKKAKKRTFVISKKCKFYDRCWAKKKKKKIKRDKAFKKFKKIKKTSMYNCEFRVKKGKVVILKFGK